MNYLFIIYSTIENLTNKYEDYKIDKDTIIEYIEPFILFSELDFSENGINSAILNVFNISNLIDNYIEEGYLIYVTDTYIMINKNNELYSKYISIKKSYSNSFEKIYNFSKNKCMLNRINEKLKDFSEVVSSDSDNEVSISDHEDPYKYENINKNTNKNKIVEENKNIKIVFKKIKNLKNEINYEDIKETDNNTNENEAIEDIIFDQYFDQNLNQDLIQDFDIDNISVESVIVDDIDNI